MNSLSAQDTLHAKDSAVSLQTALDSLQNKQADQIQKESLEQMDRNSDAFIKMQQEREKKQKQQTYIRITMGALFLVVLIVGLMRRRKTAK